MANNEFGRLVISKAGHDKGYYYVIIGNEGDYVYLADGRLKTLSKPKKKSKRHIQLTNYFACELLDKENGKLIDEDIKFFIKKIKKTL